MKNKSFFILFFFIILFLFKNNSFAVPASFLKSDSGNMRDLNWNRLENNIFSIYYEENSKYMGEYSLKSLQFSYPYLALLLGVKLPNDFMPILKSQKDRFLISSFNTVPVILGNKLEGAGFANPFTMNIETQMIHARSAAFFQHELVHRLMYEHNNFHVGPLGRVFSLAMFPTWWIEGLAEHLTESVGSAETNAVIRNMALQDSWPSWDRMHALYNTDGDTNLRGYVASGRFLRWIFQQLKEKDLYKIHEQISMQTIIPPFYDATDSWLYKNLGKNGETLYEEFKIEQKSEWENYLSQMPSLLKVSTQSVKEKYYFPSIVVSDKVIYSNLTSERSAKTSSLQIYDSKKNHSIRNPLKITGSQVFATNKIFSGTLVTADRIFFSNAAHGDRLRVIKFKGDITELNDESIENQIFIELATLEHPYVVDEIISVENGNFYISASLNGNQNIYFFDAEKKALKLVKSFSFPQFITFLKFGVNNNYSQKCLIYILNNDLNRTSLNRICEDGLIAEIIKENKFFIKEGYILKNGSYRLLIEWDKVLALIDFSPAQKENFIAAFPERVDGITPWNDENEDYMGAWIYKDQSYYFSKIDVKKLKALFSNWQKKQETNSIFSKNYQFKYYIPPFQKIYEQQKYNILVEDINEFEKYLLENSKKIKEMSVQNLDDEISDSSQKNIVNENKNIRNARATYRSNLLFVYPFFQPDFIGGPSLGLAAVPFIDEMERYRIQIFGGYNFYLDAPSGALTYLNNRLFDGFSISVFSSPFFNGYYDLISNQNNAQGSITTRYFNYLQQNGLNLNLGFNFLPSTFAMQNTFTLSNIQPYSTLRTPPAEIGAQSTTLFSAVSSISFNLFNEGFYLKNKNMPKGKWLIWKTNAQLGIGKFNSIGNAKNSVGQNLGGLDYYNLSASLLSRFTLFKQNISLLGNISTTQGNNTFNLKEVYSPVQNYILGEKTSLNFVSFPIIGSGTLFDLKAGYWSYSGTISYDFPFKTDFEKKFLMTFLDDWRGIISLKEGGVSTTKDFTSFDSVTSVGIGSGLNVDIKGFQISPSLIYGFVIGDSGWYILTQIKFMDII
ncbi:hypothetical protein [Fluviispira multicolorata]|uniref:Uncharacterized protein n=1 Tax=Fluviispira multicolorata TaxID=2654512 RepID=A0A833N667_9BACT|nr:hypothetical protein [Fluviispira multicolorata]KAB8029718.1 hypothetical protein GCL57_09235 [Fluviispira multicolorata]